MHANLRPDLGFAPSMTSVERGDPEGFGDALSQLVIPGDLHVRAACQQQIRIEACKLIGGGVMTRIDISLPLNVTHTRRHVAQAGDDILVMVAMEGRGMVSQQGKELHFGPGDITFRKANMPSAVAVSEPSRVIVFRVSKERFFGPYLRYASAFVAAMSPAGDPLAAQVQSYLVRVAPRQPLLNPVSQFLAEQSLIALLGAVYCEAALVPTTHDAYTDRWSAIVAFLDANLRDVDLSVEAVCHAVGVSKRLLHKLFEARGLRYGCYVTRRRLDRARDELENERLHGLSISEIGFRCGFGDPSHFSRCFRSAFDTSPGLYRLARRGPTAAGGQGARRSLPETPRRP